MRGVRGRLAPWLFAIAYLTLPSTAGAQDRAPSPPAEPGSELQVYVMTMGQGDPIWERFGHNALGIRDARTNTNLVYNWGVFRFTEADFLPRFLRGEMRYSVEAYDAGLTVAYYQSVNRSVGIQELDLTPAQRVAVRDYVEWNAREENKYYRYDYFSDNCSTRVRDVLDRALGGALRRQFDTIPSGRTFRDDARRLTESDVLYTGIDIGLGTPSDRQMTQWEAMFVPMTFRDLLRSARVTAPDGARRPLVASEGVVFTATRTPEPAAPTNRQLPFLLIGSGIAALLFVVGVIAPTAGRSLAATWCALAGVLGLLILGLWTLTRHVWAYENVNLLYFNPLWFGVAWIVARRAAPGPRARRFLLICAGLAAVGVVLGALRWPQASEQVALLVLVPHAMVLATVWRRVRA
ncbi:MAG: DUF4105 domain-containing protein [Gemmatimonadaceae bacterium]|nr:DUF4105 domain-containing protein [Gemmatimonadaceae bacterium]